MNINKMSYSNSIRRIRVLATLIIVLYHCFWPRQWFYHSEIKSHEQSIWNKKPIKFIQNQQHLLLNFMFTGREVEHA